MQLGDTPLVLEANVLAFVSPSPDEVPSYWEMQVSNRDQPWALFNDLFVLSEFALDAKGTSPGLNDFDLNNMEWDGTVFASGSFLGIDIVEATVGFTHLGVASVSAKLEAQMADLNITADLSVPNIVGNCADRVEGTGTLTLGDASVDINLLYEATCSGGRRLAATDCALAIDANAAMDLPALQTTLLGVNVSLTATSSSSGCSLDSWSGTVSGQADIGGVFLDGIIVLTDNVMTALVLSVDYQIECVFDMSATISYELTKIFS
jgi:hypothetical protein